MSKSKELLKNLKENPNVQIEHEEIQKEIEIGVDEKKSNEIKFINEFKELPGERLLRYMSNVGSGTISSLRDAIVYIANSEPLKDLGLKEELEKNKKRFTDRVIENFSYLLHIEISSKNKWCIAKPSINILPGLQNRAIIVGSRNDYL